MFIAVPWKPALPSRLLVEAKERMILEALRAFYEEQNKTSPLVAGVPAVLGLSKLSHIL